MCVCVCVCERERKIMSKEDRRADWDKMEEMENVIENLLLVVYLFNEINHFPFARLRRFNCII